MTHKQTQTQLQRLHLVTLYKKAHGVEEVDPNAVAEWAYGKGFWKMLPVDPVRVLRREISQALRGEYHEDPQNREVRKNHPVFDSKTGKVFWVDITKAKPEQMRLSFSGHRNRILTECRQLSLDFDSYNDNNPFGASLPPIEFNFTRDIEESKMPLQYT